MRRVAQIYISCLWYLIYCTSFWKTVSPSVCKWKKLLFLTAQIPFSQKELALFHRFDIQTIIARQINKVTVSCIHTVKWSHPTFSLEVKLEPFWILGLLLLFFNEMQNKTACIYRLVSFRFFFSFLFQYVYSCMHSHGGTKFWIINGSVKEIIWVYYFTQRPFTQLLSLKLKIN